MADGHININTGVLADIASQLRTLHDDFQNSTNLTGHYAGSMGSGDVANALNDFASDWSKKRDELVSGLDTLSKTAQTGAETWDGLDQHLADALTKASQQQSGEELMSRDWQSFDWQGANLQQGDLLPGEPYDVASLGAQMRGTADMIQKQAANLRNLVDGKGWDSASGKAFVEKVGTTADLLQKAFGRYDEAAKALGTTVRSASPQSETGWASGTEWASTLELVQVKGQDALRRGKTADAESASTQRQIDAANATPNPSPGPVPGATPPPDPAATRLASQKSTADAAVQQAGNDMQAALDLRDQQGRAVADAIHHFIDNDGLKNPVHHWWDVDWKNLIADIGHIAGLVAGIAGILALCLSWVPILGEVLGAVALIAGGIALVCDSISAMDGKGNWFDVAIDVVGLLSCGAGRMVGDAAKGAKALQGFNDLRAGGMPLMDALAKQGLKAADILPFKAGGMKLFMSSLKSFGKGMSIGPIQDLTKAVGEGANWAPRLPALGELGPNLGSAGWKLSLGGWANSTFPLGLGLLNVQTPDDFKSWEPGWMAPNVFHNNWDWTNKPFDAPIPAMAK